MRFRAFVAVLLPVALLALSPTSSANAAALPVIDQSATDLFVGDGGFANADEWPMQIFTPSESQRLAQVSLALFRDPERSVSVKVDIFPADGLGIPMSDPVYGDQVVPAAAIPAVDTSHGDWYWTEVQFSTEVELVGGQPYVIRVVPSDGAGSVYWQASTTTYTRGHRVDSDGTVITFTGGAPWQFGFRTWRDHTAALDGSWAHIEVPTSEPVDCVTEDAYCPVYSALAVGASGSSVFSSQGAGDAFVRSVDGGHTFTSTENLNVPRGAHVAAAFRASDSGVLLARRCNMWLSTDNAVHFTRIFDDGTNDEACFSSVTTSQFGSTVVATSSGLRARGVHVSQDGGVTWKSNLFDNEWSSAAVSASGAVIAAVATDNRVILSRDGGATWSDQHLSGGLGTWQAIALSGDGSTAALTDGNRVYGWATSGSDVLALTFQDRWTSVGMSSDGTVITALDASGHVLRSRDSGQSWAEGSAAPSGITTMALSRDGGTLIGASPGAMYRFDAPRELGSYTGVLAASVGGRATLNSTFPVNSDCSAGSISYQFSADDGLTWPIDTGSAGTALQTVAIDSLGLRAGAYLIRAARVGSGACPSSLSDAPGFVIYDGSTNAFGGGYYTSGGRANFAFEFHALKGGAKKGSVVWNWKGRWRFKGALGSYGKTTSGSLGGRACSSTAPCGVLTGTGNLMYFNGLAWVTVGTATPVTVNVVQPSGQSRKSAPGFVSFSFGYVSVSPQPDLPTSALNELQKAGGGAGGTLLLR